MADFPLKTGRFDKRMNLLKFHDKKLVLEKWLSYYVDRLRPKLVLGSYKIAPSIEKNIIHHLSEFKDKKSSPVAAGGGLGADVLIHYFRGSSIELFITPDSLNEIKSKLKLMPARETNCTLFNLFSPFCIYSENTEVPVAHPLLNYH